MIPWCFAYDKLNYATYISPYYAQMTNLPEKIPRVYETFKADQFSVQMSHNNPFGRIPVDQATDVTVNKDTQSSVQPESRSHQTVLHNIRVPQCISGTVKRQGARQ